MSVIFIQTVFDAEHIWGKYKDRIPSDNSSTKPYEIPHEDIFMITSPAYLQDPKTQGTADLSIRAKMADRIRWTGVTVSDETEFSVIMYSIFLNPYVKDNQQVTTTPTPEIAHPYVPIPKEYNGAVHPLDCYFEKIPEYYMACDVNDYGQESYAVQFFITQGEEILAYFQWDPQINVSPWS
ncbi:hypothetical protein WL35_31325 [Burkholderia ubonensis]|uniref:AidA/PixA family protein n=1 Tax=Burkholderia ubonensis TaxID=101571 RepID=UPI0007599DD4|nr:AidA/PixA family protein [Burkholderia ubonensis]KVQ90299.1 hypothetical protein WK09_13090 [Burkholderia ubonensis]KVR52225.1 hypothetical protein WK18_03685 [Burkholderia ubonensis]KVX07665.1 hypothetical protein WL03_29075 [Burkholderia ubonensis]KWB52432.1 hypothetical protein WL35_31325 [Burkholderia ubonensis]KWB74124.1 hypothetical protein WL41_15770 [Burkholderia ubonensis]